MAKFRPLMALPPLIFAGLAGTFWWGMHREDPDALPSMLKGKEAPALSVSSFGTGPQVSDADLRKGGVKLVNFWASWCAPCRVEAPNLDQLAKEGVTIYGINYKDDPAKAQAFLQELGSPYAATAADPNGRAAIDWGVYGVPETFVLDAKGKVLLRFPGPLTQKVIDEHIRPAMEAAAKDGTPAG